MEELLLELKVFLEMFSDKSALNYEKLFYKYGKNNFTEYIEALKKSFYTHLSILDFEYKPCVLLLSKINLTSQYKKGLLANYNNSQYGINAMEEEIYSTLSIESIDTSRDSVRRILKGGAPNTKNENKAFGIKRGLDFINDTSNKINETNLHKLYMLCVGDFLYENNTTSKGNYYRNDSVYVMGNEITHIGLIHSLIPEFMQQFIYYINKDDESDPIIKSIIIYYYFAYIHPYFDGNGRMARIVQLWYLIQKGYSQALFIPFSAYINSSKSEYYKAFEQVANNKKLSGVLDMTIFIEFFINNVFMKLEDEVTIINVLDQFNKYIDSGIITEKEKQLFKYVISAYGYNEFSTKKLEKDFCDVAYATIRTFVIKFEKLGLLKSQRYGNRVKYKIV